MVAQAIYDTIHNECNKPLQSKWYVETKNKSKFDWTYHKSNSFTVRKSGGLWLCYERKRADRISDCEREQWRLFRQLKREYEKSLNKIDDDTVLTEADKIKAHTQKRTMQLLQGLACAPRYDRIYN